MTCLAQKQLPASGLQSSLRMLGEEEGVGVEEVGAGEERRSRAQCLQQLLLLPV